jgi:Cd2+/Zn2+-exporting ATPase
MVGDGVNDALRSRRRTSALRWCCRERRCLETAACGAHGDELMKIPYALRLSRTTLRNIKVNLAISLVMKTAFVIAAVAGVATLWMAILADTGASVIVIANALRLLRAD